MALAGLFAEAVWNPARRVALRFPQGVDASLVTFVARPGERAVAGAAVLPAVVISHGLGVRWALSPVVSVGAVGRFCWTLLGAEATDAGRVVTGVSGIGAEGALAIEASL
jgi:hypothetical protein